MIMIYHKNNTKEKISNGLESRKKKGGDEGDRDCSKPMEEAPPTKKMKAAGSPEDVALMSSAQKTKCPYLDTINRTVLDFDFEKVCSVSLTNLNVYACLVCGRFFQGRGKNTHCYTHSVQMGHHVFMNLGSCRIYCLPDNYEVSDSSLDDIVRALRPSFSVEQISRLNANKNLARDIFGVSYLPGFIAMNNLKQTDYINAVVHALAHVTPLRDFFLVPENYAQSKSQLVHRFGELMRKIWSKDNYKSCVSPHELVQAVTVTSKRRFVIGKQAEGVEFTSWLLNALHQGIGGTKKSGSSIIHEVFQGKVRVTTRQRKTAAVKRKEEELRQAAAGTSGEPPNEPTAEVAAIKPADGGEETDDGDMSEEDAVAMADWSKDTTDVPFLILSLEIPATPLFKDSQGGKVIPQVPLFDVLEKYNGEKYTDILRAGYQQRKRYSLLKLPPFIIFHLSRFTKNNFYMEKNPTIVTFPVKNLDLRDYLKLAADIGFPSDDQVAGMGVSELRQILKHHDIDATMCVEKADLVEYVKDKVLANITSKYDLVANICHDSPPGQKKDSQMSPLEAGSYRVHIQNRATAQWYEIQDLHVQETMPQLVGLSESYMLVYERQGA
jgi:U4/U6.U5 tri-snRNP-associated protein 2